MNRNIHEYMNKEIARFASIESYNRFQDITIEEKLNDENETISYNYLFEIAYKKALRKNTEYELMQELKKMHEKNHSYTIIPF